MYYVYILECENGMLYTGITTDVVRRLNEHLDIKKNSKGAKFTHAFKPKRLAAVFSVKDRSRASKLEWLIKKQKKCTKLLIIDIYENEHNLNKNRLYVSSNKIKRILDS